MSQKFQRRKEDFVCEHCGVFVTGNGYTNHCPKCLWGKHVDVFPGDRLSECRGLLEPWSFSQEKQDFVVIHRCLACGEKRRNRLSSEDSMDALIALKQKGEDVV